MIRSLKLLRMQRRLGGDTVSIIYVEPLIKEIRGSGPPEAHYPDWYISIINRQAKLEENVKMDAIKTLDVFVNAAYKAGKEGKPLLVALNEVLK